MRARVSRWLRTSTIRALCEPVLPFPDVCTLQLIFALDADCPAAPAGRCGGRAHVVWYARPGSDGANPRIQLPSQSSRPGSPRPRCNAAWRRRRARRPRTFSRIHQSLAPAHQCILQYLRRLLRRQLRLAVAGVLGIASPWPVSRSSWRRLPACRFHTRRPRPSSPPHLCLTDRRADAGAPHRSPALPAPTPTA